MYASRMAIGYVATQPAHNCLCAHKANKLHVGDYQLRSVHAWLQCMYEFNLNPTLHQDSIVPPKRIRKPKLFQKSGAHTRMLKHKCMH